MTPTEFFNVIEKYRWGRTTNSQRIKRALLIELTPARAVEARAVFNDLRYKLGERLDPYVADRSDDGVADLLSHVVGLGRKRYNEILAAPKKITRVRGVVESFSYCLPTPDDYEQLQPEVHQKTARRTIVRYRSLLKEEVHAKDAKTIVSAMGILVRGDVQGFLKTEKSAGVAAERIAQRIAKQIDDVRDYLVGIAIDGTSVANPWSVRNLYTDVRYYLTSNGA